MKKVEFRFCEPSQARVFIDGEEVAYADANEIDALLAPVAEAFGFELAVTDEWEEQECT